MDCTFCGYEIPKGRGKIVVALNGKSSMFCSGKCEKNFNLGRKPRVTNWTKESLKSRGKI